MIEVIRSMKFPSDSASPVIFRTKWAKAVKPDKNEEQAAELIEAKSEILKLRAQLRHVEEERDIQKKAARYFAKEPE